MKIKTAAGKNSGSGCARESLYKSLHQRFDIDTTIQRKKTYSSFTAVLVAANSFTKYIFLPSKV